MTPTSRTHRIAVLKQDNGELAEDVVASGGDRPGTHVDEESGESFPASDPPSSWAGTGRDEDPTSDATGAAGATATGATGDRLVDSGPVEEVPERPHPAAPVPGTLPRE